MLLDRLHWLPVPQHVQFKLCMLTFKALHGLTLTYLDDLCQVVVLVGSRQMLHSVTHGHPLLVQRPPTSVLSHLP